MSVENNYRKELTGVFGYPVDENPTVVMMEAAFAALDLPWRYQGASQKTEKIVR